MDAGNHADQPQPLSQLMPPPQPQPQPQVKPAVVFTGTANKSRTGPPVGLVDIGVSEGAYLFQVALPGIRKDQGLLKCDIDSDGKVHIQGVISDLDGGILKDSSAVFKMKVQQLCPPGPFSVSFALPGPVDPRLFSLNYRTDGILEGVIMKSKTPSDTPEDDLKSKTPSDTPKDDLTPPPS